MNRKALMMAFIMALSLCVTISVADFEDTDAADVEGGDPIISIGGTGYTTIDAAIAAANSNASVDEIELLSDIINTDYSKSAEITINVPSGDILEGNGHTIEGNVSVKMAVNGGEVRNVQFKNIHNDVAWSEDEKDMYEFESGSSVTGDLSTIYSSGLTGNLKILDCAFDGSDWDAIQITPVAGASITITGCTFKSTDSVSDHPALRYIHVESESDTDFSATIIDNNFYDVGNLIDTPLEVYFFTDPNKMNLSGNYFDDAYSVCIKKSKTPYHDLALPFKRTPESTEADLYPAAYIHFDGNRYFFLNLKDAIESRLGSTITIIKDLSEDISVNKRIVLVAEHEYTGSIDAGKSTVVLSTGKFNIISINAGKIEVRNASVTINDGVAVNIDNRYGNVDVRGGQYETDVSNFCSEGYESILVNDVYIVGKVPTTIPGESIEIGTGPSVIKGAEDEVVVEISPESVSDVRIQSIQISNTGSDTMGNVVLDLAPLSKEIADTIVSASNLSPDSIHGYFDLEITIGGSFKATIKLDDVPSGHSPSVITINADGTGTEVLDCVYSEGSWWFTTTHTTPFVVVLNEVEDDPTIPDDDDELPFIPPQSNDGGADTTTYVAVAAAAAVVAILAVLAVGISKGKL